MATLDDIMNVNIGLQTAAVPQATFNIPLIYGPASFAGWTRTYSSMPNVSIDGLSPEVLVALSDIFAQTPSPNMVMVGRASFGSMQVSYPVVMIGEKVSITDATADIEYSVTVAQGQASTDVMNAIAAQITAGATQNFSAIVDVNGVMTIVYLVDTHNEIDLSPTLVASNYMLSPLLVPADLDFVAGENNNWYGIVTTSRVPDFQFAVATWAESHKKLHGLAAATPDVIDPVGTTDILSRIKNAQFYRTYGGYQTNAAKEYPDAAWMGAVFPLAAGSETWAMKRLGSVTPDNLSDTDRGTVFKKNGNTFEYYSASLALTNPGKVAAGEWIDIIRGRDWLANNIQVNLVQMMVNRPKVPYTDSGIQLCAANLKASLKQGVTDGFLAPEELDDSGNVVPSFIVTAPLSSDVPDAVKASRVLSLSFNARVAGAIHAGNISGSVSYSLNG